MDNFFKNLYYGAFLLSSQLNRCAGYIVYPFAKLLSIVLCQLPPFKQGLEKQNITAEENFNRTWKMGRRFANDDFIGSQRHNAAEFLLFCIAFVLLDIAIILKKLLGNVGFLVYISGGHTGQVMFCDVILSTVITGFITHKYEDIEKLKAFRKKPKKIVNRTLFMFLGCFVFSIALFLVFFIQSARRVNS